MVKNCAIFMLIIFGMFQIKGADANIREENAKRINTEVKVQCAKEGMIGLTYPQVNEGGEEDIYGVCFNKDQMDMFTKWIDWVQSVKDDTRDEGDNKVVCEIKGMKTGWKETRQIIKNNPDISYSCIG